MIWKALHREREREGERERSRGGERERENSINAKSVYRTKVETELSCISETELRPPVVKLRSAYRLGS